MKKFLAVLAGLAMLVAPANAGLRLFFAPQGVDSETAPITVAPTVSNPEASLNAGATQRLYLYAQMFGAPNTQKWNGLAFDVLANGGVISGRALYNYNVQDEFGDDVYRRWQGVNQGAGVGTSTVSGINLAAVTSGNGVTNDALALLNDGQSEVKLLNSRTLPKATLLGYFDFQLATGSNMATIFIRIGQGGIVRSGATAAEPVYLGVGDETAGLTGQSFNQTSPNFDAKLNLIPEPASILLLSLAGLALRRR